MVVSSGGSVPSYLRVRKITVGGLESCSWVRWQGLRLLQRQHLLEWRLGLWCICVWRIMFLKLLLHVSHLPIGSKISSVHRMSLVHINFCSALQMFCGVSVSCGLNPPFLWVKMAVHYSCGAHIGMHRLIFSGFLMISPIATVVSLPG